MATTEITIPASDGTTAPPPSAVTGGAPISPVDEGTKANLDKLLAHRPDKSELVDKNILHSGNLDPSLEAKRLELEKSLLEDKLNSALQHRPPPSELVREGILNEDEAPTAVKSLPTEGEAPSQ